MRKWRLHLWETPSAGERDCCVGRGYGHIREWFCRTYWLSRLAGGDDHLAVEHDVAKAGEAAELRQFGGPVVPAA